QRRGLIRLKPCDRISDFYTAFTDIFFRQRIALPVQGLLRFGIKFICQKKDFDNRYNFISLQIKRSVNVKQVGSQATR
ncbi:MAG TPA: hypothetical protein PK939_12070, partial [Bacteroidales bacterium]|nr:hypothetical protein [Bacteroidales bacterium]